MPLKSLLDSLDGVPEGLQGAYRKRGDGKYVLDVEGFDDVPNVLTALGRERTRANDLERQVTTIRDRFKDIDPEKAREAQRILDDLEAEKIIAGGKLDRSGLDKFVETRVKALKEEADGKIKNLSTANEKLTAKLRSHAITNPLKTALAKAKVRSDMIDLMAEKLGGDWSVDDDFNPYPLADDRKSIRYGKDASTPMTSEEYVEVVGRKMYPSAFEGSSGSGAPPNSPGAAGQFSISRNDARDPAKYRAATEAAQKAGQTVNIVGE